jgi:Methyltransferase domain
LRQTKFRVGRLLEQLRRGWGNQDWSGRTAYLEEVVKWAAITPGPVLECGSGLTTILLGLYAGRRGVSVWTLEHTFDWHKRVSTVLSNRHISGVELSVAPICDYGTFSWYDPPLSRMPAQFKLVVCDGPPERATRGKRYGLLPVMGKRLANNCVILLDDLNIEVADNVINLWAVERVAMTKILKADESQSFGLMFLD